MTGKKELYISNIFHKAFVEIDEAGAEAAAATAVVLNKPRTAKSDIEKAREIIKFIVDRPFLFAIVDTKSKALIFLGRITDL